MQTFLVAMLALFFALSLGACQKPHAESSLSLPKSTKTYQDGKLVLTAEQTARAQLQTCKIEFDGLSRDLEFSSIIEAPIDDVGTVAPQLNGVVTKVLVDLGDHVKKGQVLLYVNSPDVAESQANYFDALSRVTRARAEKDLIKIRLEIAAKDRQRLEELVAEGISSKRDLESSQARHAATKAELVASEAAANAAEAQLAAARVRLNALGISKPSQPLNGFTSELPLLSPRTGIVVQRNVIAGQGVSPTSATLAQSLAANNATATTNNALLSIANLSKVWVMLEVPQSQAAFLDRNSKVKFETEVAPGVTFLGKITKMGQHYDPVSHCVAVRTEIDNSQGLLKPGMMIIARVHVKTREHQGFTVPSASLQNIDGKDYVFVREDQFTFRPVQVNKLSDDNDCCMISGDVRAGDEVATKGSFILKTELVKGRAGNH